MDEAVGERAVARNVNSTAPSRGSLHSSRSSPGIVVDGAHTSTAAVGVAVAVA